MNMSKNKTNRFMPFIMAFCVVIGIIIEKMFSQIIHKIISTQLLTVLTTSVILLLEQKETKRFSQIVRKEAGL